MILISIICFSLIPIISAQLENQRQFCPNATSDLLIDNFCYEFIELPAGAAVTFDSASGYCATRDKTLAVIQTPVQQQKIANRFAEMGWNRAFIGLCYQKSGWKWADRSPLLLRGQGCQEVKEIDTSKLSSEYSRMMSNDGCIAFCSKAGHHFAANMAGSFCYCSTEFMWRQPASQCDLPCSGLPDQFCGSYTNSLVFYTAEFAFDNWRRGRPSVGGSCAAIQVDGVNNEWVDVSCTYARPFLCRYDITDNVPTLNVAEMACGNNDTCYYLYASPQLNWADANRFCSKAGGHLATVDSQERQDMVNTLVARLVNVSQIWIGANNYDWVYDDGTVPTFRGWISAEEPTFPAVHSCAEAVITTLTTTEGPTFGWKSRTCDVLEGTPNRLICSAPAMQIQPPATNSGMLNLSSNSTISNATKVKEGLWMPNNRSEVAAILGLISDSGQQEREIPWWGILLIVLASFILIAVLVVVIVVFSKKSGKRISPEMKKKARRREATQVIEGVVINGRNQTLMY